MGERIANCFIIIIMNDDENINSIIINLKYIV
jgi:hypothetical protein